MLAAGVAYLRALDAGGCELDAARAMIYFRLAADADQFLTVAKFRALRKLWARVENACGLTPRPAFLAAETAWRMMTRRDPYVNLLRATLAVFSAALGGADAVTVLPFTMALGLPDRFARRIARNTQIVLIEEANLAKVGDPAAGAGGMEDLTDQLCLAAWALFQDIEKAGGALAALEKGLVQTAVAGVRAKREHAVARRIEALTGTSDFSHISEDPVSVLDVAPVTLATALATGEAASSKIALLSQFRLAEPFERLRDRADLHRARTGERSSMFLANLGTPADFAARASFARNLFEAGGIEVKSNGGFASQADVIDSFKASGAKLACLCSSDAVYEQKGVSAVEALSAAGAAVWIAGRPVRLETAFIRAGARGFVFAGCDALSALEAAHAAIEPAPG